jgi:replication initiation and membrane attachment protein DnaB
MNRLSQMGMTGQDKAALTQIFAQYKAKAAAITAAFNQTAQATIENGGTVEIETVLQQQADLMKAMQQEIASTLSTDGETFFLRFVQQEKAGIVLITK